MAQYPPSLNMLLGDKRPVFLLNIFQFDFCRRNRNKASNFNHTNLICLLLNVCRFSSIA